jgi:hypothetical protein
LHLSILLALSLAVVPNPIRIQCSAYYSAGDIPAKEYYPMIKKLVLTVLIVLATPILVSCAPRTTTTILPPEDGAAYAAEVDEIVENYITGISENNYAKYTRDMDKDFLEVYGSDEQQIAEEISSDFGAYLSKTLDHVEGQRLRRTVVYHLVFENEPDVLLKVIFNIFDSKHIIGTYWNSE